VNPTLQVEKVIVIRESNEHSDSWQTVPKFEVEWSSRWQEFVESIKPAFRRSEARLAGEAPIGLIPLRIMIPSYVIEAFVIFAAIAIQVKIAELGPTVSPRISTHEVIYYSGDELPRTEDLGGAQAAAQGRAGGEEAYHRTQTIKIARGASLVPRVVDAPNLKLPSSTGAVANLLAIHPDPGPPPAEGLRSSRSAPSFATTIVAPAPNVIRDYTRNGVPLDTVIAPAPSVTRDRSLHAPTLSTTLIPPAPNVSGDHTLVAPALTPEVIAPVPSVARDRRSLGPSLNAQIVAPAPNVSRDQARPAPTLDAQIVAPAPNVSRDQNRSAPALSGSVIPPSPAAVTREVSGAPVEMTSASVVPPPVSAPERATHRNSLTLPAPEVVAPPPSADLSHDTRQLAGGNVDPGKAVVPPPPSQPASGSFMNSLIGKIFGTSEVVPPPPPVNSKSGSGTASPTLAANVVPPPPSVSSKPASGGSPSLSSTVVPPPPSVTANGRAHGNGKRIDSSLSPKVVAPPPSVGLAAGTGNSSSWTGPIMSSPNVVPPPPSLAGTGGGTGETPGGKGVNGGTLLANNVVPPPPSVNGGTSSAGSGVGRKGASLGAPTDAGSALAPPNTGGSSAKAGAVISKQPGTEVGLPPTGSAGALALSPAGREQPGLGGGGGGASIAHGEGSGSAMKGSDSGSAKSGAGNGAEPNAREGISLANGPGGAGNLPAGNPPVRGADVSGGTITVTIPGFGSNSASSDPGSSKRTSLKGSQTFDVDIVATATSGGAFEPYFEPYKKLLHGEVHLIPINTSAGTVVMQFADNAAAAHSFAGALSLPVVLRKDLPEGMPHARMVLACTLDAAGNLRNLRVLEPGPATMTAKVLSALRAWKFQPAMRSGQPVEVTAILGFGITTDDRF
jgi:TonB family protein